MKNATETKTIQNEPKRKGSRIGIFYKKNFNFYLDHSHVTSIQSGKSNQK